MRWRRVAAAACVALVVAGCWDRREINDVAMVAASAVDMTEDGQYQVTVQIPLPSQMAGIGNAGGGGGTSGSQAWFADTTTGATVREANAVQQKQLSRQLNFAHRRVVLIGERAARNGVASFIDIFVRVPQNRLTAYVAVARGDAADTINVDAPVEQFSAEMIRELVQGSMNQPRFLTHFLDTMLADGIDPYAPAIERHAAMPSGGARQHTTIRSIGLAVFREDRLAGFLTGEKAMGALLAMGQISGQSLTVKVPPGENGSVSLRITATQAKVTPVLTGRLPAFQIHVKVVGSLVANDSTFQVSEAGNVYAFNDAVNQHVKGLVEAAVKALQQEFQSDILGLGDLLYRRAPGRWAQLRGRWREVYPEVKVSVHVQSTIQHTGSALAPMGHPAKEIEP